MSWRKTKMMNSHTSCLDCFTASVVGCVTKYFQQSPCMNWRITSECCKKALLRSDTKMFYDFFILFFFFSKSHSVIIVVHFAVFSHLYFSTYARTCARSLPDFWDPGLNNRTRSGTSRVANSRLRWSSSCIWDQAIMRIFFKKVSLENVEPFHVFHPSKKWVKTAIFFIVAGPSDTQPTDHHA